MGSVVPEPRRVEEGIVAEIRISMIFQSTVKRLTPFGADILGFDFLKQREGES